jgi:adenine-specific DNA-methyltransferase
LAELKSDINPLSSWLANETYSIGLNSEGTKIIQNLFEEKVFDYPKPISLVRLLLSQILSKNDIVLDSFAGSGTTAHAVLHLNKQDGGNRKFILIEMEDYAETITAERVKRVTNGYGSAGSQQTEGTGGSFDFYELGQPLFLEDGNLNELAGEEKIRQYVFYAETKSSLNHNLLDLHDDHNKSNLKNQGSNKRDNKHFLGKHNDTAYYFNYERNEITTLDHAFLSTMKTKAEQYVIYADNCLLTKGFMIKHNIIFKKIPRDITKF